MVSAGDDEIHERASGGVFLVGMAFLAYVRELIVSDWLHGSNPA